MYRQISTYKLHILCGFLHKTAGSCGATKGRQKEMLLGMIIFGLLGASSSVDPRESMNSSI